MTENSSNEATEVDCVHLTGKHNVCDGCRDHDKLKTEFDKLKKRLASIKANGADTFIEEIREDIQKAHAVFVNAVGQLEICQGKLKELAGK